MYLTNKYSKWYNNIISNAQARGYHSRAIAKLNLGYTENHHIIPTSLGGIDDKTNTVFLTAKEHFTCHHLLTKMVDGTAKYKMDKAISKMLSTNQFQQRIKVSSRLYEQIRINAGKAASAMNKGMVSAFKGKTHSQETKDKIGALAKLRPRQVRSEKSKAKVAASLKGKPKTQSHKDAIKATWNKEARSGINHPGFGKQATEETRNKMKVSSVIRWDETERQRVSEQRAKDPVFVCPGCSKNIKGKGNLTQHTRRCAKYSIMEK